MERSIDGGATFTIVKVDGIVPPNNISQRSIEGAGLNDLRRIDGERVPYRGHW